MFEQTFRGEQIYWGPTKKEFIEHDISSKGSNKKVETNCMPIKL